MSFEDHGIIVPSGASGEFQTTCPKCSQDRKKSHIKCLSVNIDEGVWFCHHCGWKGGIKSEPMRKFRPLVIENKKQPENKVVEWFKKRGISENTVNKFGIFEKDIYFQSAGKKMRSICFPFYLDGEIYNVKYRSGNKDFMQEKGGAKILYGMQLIEPGNKVLTITEGEIDAMTFHECGYKNAVSVPDGAPSINATNFDRKFEYLENCQDFIQSFDYVVLAVDNDEPGRKLCNELARRIGYDKAMRLTYPEGCKDANEVFLKYGQSGFDRFITTANFFPINGIIDSGGLNDSVWNLYHNGFDAALNTGLNAINDIYKIRPGEMTIWTGKTGHGKSEFLDQIIINMAKDHGWRFAVCSMENLPYERHVKKLAEKYIGMPFFEGYNQRMTETDLKVALDFINDHFYFISPGDGNFDIDFILNTTKQLIYQKGVNGLVIDPYNELDHNRPNNVNEHEYVSLFLSKVRRFTRFNNIHLWVVAHPVKPPRDQKDWIPDVYDISGSSNWANKADNAITICRLADSDLVEFHVKKIRFKECGKIGMATVKYDNICGRYYDI